MNLVVDSSDLNEYLMSNSIVDFKDNDKINSLALSIKIKSKSEIDFVKNVYEWVRDNISHSHDILKNSVTFTASEVLTEGHGTCFAKSNLLAALLRSQGIPCGFCYQKLILDDETAPYLILHGLNAVYLSEINKWIRLDARGNKDGVDAQFLIDHEQLAFPVRKNMGEEDIPIIYANPSNNIAKKFSLYDDLSELWNNLPNQI